MYKGDISMNKGIVTGVIATALCLGSFTSFAGQWVQMGENWTYMTDNGVFVKDKWLWLDENHDGKAELYHFDANGMMSKSTTVDAYDEDYAEYPDEKLFINVDQNGAATTYKDYMDGQWYEKIMETVDIPRYKINFENGSYKYYLPEGIDHYNFAEIKYAWIDNNITDCGDYYSAKVYPIVKHMGSAPGLIGLTDLCLTTEAFFAEDCKVHVVGADVDNDYTSIDREMSISELAEKKNLSYNYLEVNSVDDDGYITSCYVGPAE